MDDAAERIYRLIALDLFGEVGVPFTARLSRKFHEQFGDEITSELVDWFNAVDVNYQAQLREMNDLNWERFKATLLAESASIRGEVHSGLADLRVEMHREIGGVQTRIDGLYAEIHSANVKQLRWIMGFCTGSFLAVAGTFLTMVQMLSR